MLRHPPNFSFCTPPTSLLPATSPCHSPVSCPWRIIGTWRTAGDATSFPSTAGAKIEPEFRQCHASQFAWTRTERRRKVAGMAAHEKFVACPSLSKTAAPGNRIRDGPRREIPNRKGVRARTRAGQASLARDSYENRGPCQEWNEIKRFITRARGRACR